MNVGFVVTHTSTVSPGSIVRVRELARSLASMGVTIHVYSPYTEPEPWGENITCHRIPSLLNTLGLQDLSYSYTRRLLNSRISSLFLNNHFLDPSINGISHYLEKAIQRDDLDIIQGEQEIAASACARLRGRVTIPIFSSLHNIWPEELVATGLIKKTSKEYGYLIDIEREIVENSEHVIVVSSELKKYLGTIHGGNHVTVVPPGGRLRATKWADNPAPFKVVYAGLVEKRANLDLFARSMKPVKEQIPDAKFYITNRGEDLSRIRRLTKNMGIDVDYYWYPKSQDFFGFLSTCHIGILSSSDDLPRRIGPAVKLFDYLSVGLPVVGNDIGGWTRIIEEKNLGLLAEEDASDLSEGIVKLLLDENLRRHCGESAIEFVKTECNWDHSAKILLNKYHDYA